MILVNEASMRLVSKTASASNQVASETKEKEKAAFYPFRRLLNKRRIHAKLILVAIESKSWPRVVYSYHWAVSYKFQYLVFKSPWNLLGENFNWS